MFLFGEIFKVMLYILAMFAIYLNSKAYMYYVIIIFEDIVVETLMIIVACILYHTLEGDITTLILVIIAGVLA